MEVHFLAPRRPWVSARCEELRIDLGFLVVVELTHI
jgi:hypothetical protein